MKAFYMRVNDDNQVMMMDLKKQIQKKIWKPSDLCVNGDKQSGDDDDM